MGNMTSPVGNVLTVMIVEDDPSTVALLTTLLNLEGYAVKTPKNHRPQGLLSSIRDEHPQVVLIDVNLSTGNGLDLVRFIRSEPDLSNISILVTSGLNLKKESLQMGADNFIQKPFMPDELIKLIQKTYHQSLIVQPQKE